MSTPTAIDDRVLVGITVLDEKHPTWRDHVDVDIFDITSCYLCVLGQVYGDYFEGLRQLAPDNRRMSWAAANGFTAYSNEWDLLTEAWKRQLT